MGILDSWFTKVLEEEQKEKSGKQTGKSSSASESEKRLAHELAAKIAELERKEGALDEREKLLSTREQELKKKTEEAKALKAKQLQKLEEVGSLSQEKAKDLLLDTVEKQLSEDIAKKIRDAQEEIKLHSEEKARSVILDVLQHGVTDYVAEYTVSTVVLPDEEMKGRIIGREGRNIRAFERATGVEIELDEANVIHLSSFDSVRREVARRSIEKLIHDRRIQPARIGEIVEKTRQEMDRVLFEEGERLCHAVNVFRLHPDLIKMLGRFKFRFSYGQNMIIHTLEETKIAVQLAYELGANVNVVRLGCLLHDIGKVVSEEEGTHVQLGVSLARKYRLPEEVITCIAEHHEDVPFTSAESRIVWIADAASGSRPGARYEPHEDYVQRLEQIEKIARNFPQVKEAYAYQAGRFLMVMVNPESTKDDDLVILADKIARQLEQEASYAGQIKVSCIRELQATEMTKAK